jgi:polysaccharide biosynthesis protein PslH
LLLEDVSSMVFLWLAHAIPYPPKAGFLLRSYNLLKRLATRHNVDLVAFVQEAWVTTLFPSLEAGLDESHRALAEFCRSVTFLPIDSLARPWGKERTALRCLLSGSSYSTSWLHSTPARAAIAHQLRTTRYDLVHFDTIGLVAYRDLCAGTPAALTHHNIESHMMLRRADTAGNVVASSYFRHEGRLLEQTEVRTADTFATHITCSELDSERLRRLVPDANVAVIPNGVDCEYFVSQDRVTRPDSLAFVGTMNWYPNVDAMMFFLNEVWPRLRSGVPTVTLDIAGSNPPAALIRLAESLPGVTVHGYLPDVRPLIDSAALMICPIRDGGGTKLKILDAFAMQKCVVAHPIACEGIAATADREVVLATTAEEFVAAIAALLKDPDRRAAIGRAARALVESRYSYEPIGARFSALLEQTARAHRGDLRA